MSTSRRSLLAAGALAVGSTLVTTPSAGAEEGDYGSGTLGPWENAGRAISTPEIIRAVRDGNGIYMFGDSISVQDGKALATLLNNKGKGPLAVHNWSSRPTKPAVDALASWARTYGLTDRILMATGTNDIFNPPVFAAEVERTMDIAGPNRIVYWVNVQVARTNSRISHAMRLADQRNSGWINLQLAKAAVAHRNLRIIGWAEFLAAKPARMSPENYLEDGVHTTVPLGQNARNALIEGAIAAV